jgi:hypothetical protein
METYIMDTFNKEQVQAFTTFKSEKVRLAVVETCHGRFAKLFLNDESMAVLAVAIKRSAMSSLIALKDTQNEEVIKLIRAVIEKASTTRMAGSIAGELSEEHVVLFKSFSSPKIKSDAIKYCAPESLGVFAGTECPFTLASVMVKLTEAYSESLAGASIGEIKARRRLFELHSEQFKACGSDDIKDFFATIPTGSSSSDKRINTALTCDFDTISEFSDEDDAKVIDAIISRVNEATTVSSGARRNIRRSIAGYLIPNA